MSATPIIILESFRDLPSTRHAWLLDPAFKVEDSCDGLHGTSDVRLNARAPSVMDQAPQKKSSLLLKHGDD